MAFIKTVNLDKRCPVLVNINKIMEVAPLTTGGVACFMDNGQVIKINISFDDLQKQLEKEDKEEELARNPEKRFPGRPKKVVKPPRKKHIADRMTCEHCGVDIDEHNYKRWHGDRCKENPANKPKEQVFTLVSDVGNAYDLSDMEIPSFQGK